MIIIGPFTLLLLLVLFCRPLRRLFGFALGALILVLWLCWPSAKAAEIDCTQPPYGDTMPHYEAFIHSLGTIMPASHIVPAVCAAKFKGGDREWLYDVGITPQQIDSLAVIGLTVKTMTAMRAYLRDAPASQTDSVTAEMNARLAAATASAMSTDTLIPSALRHHAGIAKTVRTQPAYETVQTFTIHSHDLIARHAIVALTGTYVMQGLIAMMYEDGQAISLGRYTAASPPTVPIETDHASPELQAALIACNSNPAYAQIGCRLVVTGTAAECALQNSFGATTSLPCVDARDGHQYSVAPPAPPPQTPTPQQVQTDAIKAAQRVARQQAALTWAHQRDVGVCEKNLPKLPTYADMCDRNASSFAPSPQDAVFQNCMVYMQSTGQAEKTPNEFHDMCEKQAQE